jgi:hypothetical protein
MRSSDVWFAIFVQTDIQSSSSLPKSFPRAIVVPSMVFLPQQENLALSSPKVPSLEYNLIAELADSESPDH